MSNRGDPPGRDYLTDILVGLAVTCLAVLVVAVFLMPA